MCSHINAMCLHINAMCSHINAMCPHINAMCPHINAMCPHINTMCSHINAMCLHINAMSSHLHMICRPENTVQCTVSNLCPICITPDHSILIASFCVGISLCYLSKLTTPYCSIIKKELKVKHFYNIFSLQVFNKSRPAIFNQSK